MHFIAENCMKIKEFGPLGVYIPGAPLDPPLITQRQNRSLLSCFFCLFFFVTRPPRQRRPGQRPPPYSKEQAVHILLECILFSTVALLESHLVHNLYFKKQFSIEFQSLDTHTIVICEVCLVRHFVIHSSETTRQVIRK